MRRILFAIVLLSLAACDPSVTGVAEKYRSLPGEISLRAIGESESKCLATENMTPAGDLLQNASVTAIDKSGARSDMTTATDASGEARISLLTGIYDIRIVAEGFEPTTIEGNLVTPDTLTALGDVYLAKVEDDYFPNGVAAGDVETYLDGLSFAYESSVVLWTRGASPGTVTFEYDRDPDFSGAPDGIHSKKVSFAERILN